MDFKLLLYLFTLLITLSCTRKQPIEQFIEQTPWGEEVFILPQFPDNIYSIEDYKAKSQVGFNNQEPIQKAIDECSKNGGGTVLIPEGTWETSYLRLKSNVNLYISEGALLSFLDSIPLYNIPTFTRWEGIECINYHPLIYAKDENNVAITGQGKILGNGQAWWYMKGLTKKTLSKLYDQVEANVPPEKRNCLAITPMSDLRPPLVQLINCEAVHLDGFEIGSGPFWTIHLVYCNNVVANNLKVITDGVNNDGIIPDASSKVLIQNCFFSTGDDCIVIKSGLNEDGWRVGKTSERIVVKDCKTKHGHGGIVIGSEMSGGAKNVYAYDCNFSNTERGIRVKSMKGRGGVVENLWFDNIQMDSIKQEAIMLNMDYQSSSIAPRSDSLPVFQNFNFNNIISTHSKYCLRMIGMEEMQIHNMSFSNLTMSGEYGISMSYGNDLRFDSINITSQRQVPVQIADTEDISIQSLFCKASVDTMITLTGENKNIRIQKSNIEEFRIPFFEGITSDITIQ